MAMEKLTAEELSKVTGGYSFDELMAAWNTLSAADKAAVKAATSVSQLRSIASKYPSLSGLSDSELKMVLQYKNWLP